MPLISSSRLNLACCSSLLPFSQLETLFSSKTEGSGSPSTVATPNIKSNVAPSAVAAGGRAKSDGSKGKNKFEMMCVELASSAEPGAVATLKSSLQPEQLLAAVRAEIAEEDAGAEAAAECASMSDTGPSSQSASPAPASSIDQPYFAVHTRINKRRFYS